MKSLFFFDLVAGGDPLIDAEGASFEGIDAAARHGERCVRDLVAHDILESQPVHLDSYLAILDPGRRELRRIYYRDVVRILGCR